MSQTEHARVQALLESGRITEDEAEILFAALGERDENPREAQGLPSVSEKSSATAEPLEPSSTSLHQSLRQSIRQGTEDALKSTKQITKDALRSTGLDSAEPPAVPSAPPPRPPEPPRTPNIDAAAQQWVKLSGFCGDLSVEADASLSSPVVTGKATLERTPEGDYLIRTPPQAKGESNWLTRLHQAAGDVRVRLPADMGLDLRIAAGDGEVRGVKTVKGSFTGGDFELSEAETLDLTVTAGDATLKLRPRTGEQRLRATSGDVDVTFLAGSSVTVSGSATCGDLSLPNGFARSGGFVGGNFEGTLGAGEARLELRLTAGDVDIRAERA